MSNNQIAGHDASRALITGVSGFVGCHLAEHLIESGDQVLGTSHDGRWLPMSPKSLTDQADRVELIPWDFSATSDATRDRIEQFAPTVIYHLAAISVPTDCGIDQPNPLATSINVGGTQQVVELAERLSTRPRVISISSSHVYAPSHYRDVTVDDLMNPPIVKLNENAPIGPMRGYGITKLAAEAVVRHAIEQRDVDAVIVRAFQHAGPRQMPRMMLPEWIGQLIRNPRRALHIHSRDIWIDVSDVRDVVRGYRLIATKAPAGQTYNIGSGTAHRTGDLIDILLQHAGIAEHRVIETAAGLKLDPVADTTRLNNETGWEPMIPIRQTITDTYDDWHARLRPD